METDTKLHLGTTVYKKLSYTIGIYYSKIFRIFVNS